MGPPPPPPPEFIQKQTFPPTTQNVQMMNPVKPVDHVLSHCDTT